MAISKEDDLPKIGQYILDGLTTDEACTMAGFLPKELKELIEKDAGAKAYIEKQHIAYKHEHLKIINKAKNEKSSQWLLEKTRPEQFGSKRQAEHDPLDVFRKLITEIQRNDSSIINAEIIEVEPQSLPAGAKREGVRSVLN